MKPIDTPCDLVAERVALGDSLGEHADHAEACETCRALVATAGQLALARVAPEPSVGFAARMTVGAQRRFDVRRRRRVAAGVAGAVAAAAIGVFVVTRAPASSDIDQHVAVQMPKHDSDPPAPPVADPDVNADAIRALVRLSDVEHSRHLGARWGRIERPLQPYRAILKGK